MTHHDPHGAYVIQLLAAKPFRLDAARLATSLERYTSSSTPGDGELEVSFDDGSTATFSMHPGLAHPADVDAALSQTWDWPDAERVVKTAKATCVIQLAAPAESDRRVKLRRVHAMIQAAAEQLELAAIHWMPSQRLVEPQHWRESVHHGSPPGDHAINVRLFKVPDGKPGEAILDTMGLAAFGLRDLQCHFAGLDLQGLAMLLFSYAEYVFERGDVLDDTSLVRGLQSHEEWECHRERALAPPDREVVDIRAGDAAILR